MNYNYKILIPNLQMPQLKLDVPYYSQLNNDTNYFGAGWRQCNVTSNAMALAFLVKDFEERSRKNEFNEPESYLASKWNIYGDTTNHQAGTKALNNHFNLRSEWRYDLSKRRVQDLLSNGKPVPMGVAYKHSGHIICVVGYDDKGFFVHDPYGIRDGANDVYTVGANGAYDHFSWSLCDQVIFDGGINSAWGRVFY
jgi:uncharacterized protein YvpB